MASERFGRKFFPDMRLENLDVLDKFKLHPGKRTVYCSLIECVKLFLLPRLNTITSATMPANSLHFEKMLSDACEDVDYRGGILIDRDIGIIDRFTNKDMELWKPAHFDLFDLTSDEVANIFLPYDLIWLDMMCLFTVRYYELIQTIINSATGTFIVSFTVYHGRGKQYCEDPAKEIIANSRSGCDIIELSTVRYQSFTGTRMSTYILGIISK